MANRGLIPILAVVCGLLMSWQWAKAVDPPTISTASAVWQPTNTTYNVSASGTFPTIAGALNVSTRVEVRWTKDGQTPVVEPTYGSGVADNTAGTFSGNRTGCSPPGAGWNCEVRVLIRGRPKAGDQIQDLTAWSAWTLAPKQNNE